MKSMYDDFDFDDKKDSGNVPPERDPENQAAPSDAGDGAVAGDVPAPPASAERDGAGIPDAPVDDGEPEASGPAAATVPDNDDDGVTVTDLTAAAPRSRLVGLVNLVLLITVIGLQVLIISWQRSVTRSLGQLQEEVNLEKTQRIELGSDLLKKIDNVMQTKTVAAPVEAAAGVTVYMTTSKVNVRQGKSAKTKLVAKVKRAGIVTEAAKSGTWTQISFGNKSGWVLGKYLSEIGTVKIKASELSVRAEPSKKGKILAKVKRNARGKVLDYRDQYFKADFNGTAGWVHRKYVSALK